MSVRCDICKTEVADGTRFCPKCGIEIVSARERASRPVPMEKDVFDWNEKPGSKKEYDFNKKTPVQLDANRAAELLGLAESRMNEGHVLDAFALLKQIQPQVGRLPALRARVDRLDRAIAARHQSIREQCGSWATAGDAAHIVGLLAGQAANELEPDTVCVIALAAARKLFEQRRADGAAEILRLPPFRTLRVENLVQEHRELELRVHRMRARQHAIKSVLFLGSIMVAAAVGLGLFAVAVWRGGIGIAVWFLVPIAIIAAVCYAVREQIFAGLQSWAAPRSRRSRTAQKLAKYLEERHK